MRRKRQSAGWTWGAVVTVLVPLSTLALVLLGYGYTLAVQSIFGIDAALVASSLPEYLQLSSHVVVHLLTAVAEAVQRRQTYERLYADSVLWLAVGAAFWVVFFLVWLPRAWWAREVKRLSMFGERKLLSSLPQLASWISPARGWIDWALERLAITFHFLIRAPRALWWALASLALILGWPVITLGLAIAAVFVIGYLFGLLPLVGYGVGYSALQKWIVAPAECVAVRSRDQILVDQLPLPSETVLVTGANCVCLERAGKEIARGRLVVATTEAVILFDPMTGRTQRITVGDAIIRPVSSLD